MLAHSHAGDVRSGSGGAPDRWVGMWSRGCCRGEWCKLGWSSQSDKSRRRRKPQQAWEFCDLCTNEKVGVRDFPRWGPKTLPPTVG
jgi:hypothetical protein